MEEEIVYQFRAKLSLWKKFRTCLRKVYCEEGMSISNWIIKSIEKFVKENE